MDAGYSGTPLPKKLGLKPGSRVRYANAPAGLAESLGYEPAPGGEVDVCLLFLTRKAELEELFPHHVESIVQAGAIWICWPKKASKVPSDVTEQTLRDIILPTGWVDNKVCAIDSVWSGLRFVRRISIRT